MGLSTFNFTDSPPEIAIAMLFLVQQFILIQQWAEWAIPFEIHTPPVEERHWYTNSSWVGC